MLFDTGLLISRPTAPAGRSGPPVVRAKVAGEATLLAVDTGATETLLTRQFVERLKVPVVSAEPGLDHAGEDVPTWTCAETLTLEIDAFATPLVNTPVIRAPPHFDAAGLGGILCPQGLHEHGTLLLDLAGHRIGIRDAPLEAADVRPVRHHELRAMTLDRLAVPGEAGRLMLVEGAFEACEPAPLMLNTGTWEAEAAPGKRAGPSAADRAWGKGLSGASVRGSRRRGRVMLGGADILAPDIIVRPQPWGLGGQLGMQVLRHTCIAVCAHSRKIRLWTPLDWRRD